MKRCLVEGTQITLADGSKKTIEQLSESDQLLSMGENGALSMSSIGEIVSSTAPGYLEVVTSHGTVRATGTHPFYTGSDLKNGRDSQFRPLSDFKVGEYLVIREGDGLRRVEIRAIRKVDRPTRVFNLHNVQGPHTFIADDYVVHNK